MTYTKNIVKILLLAQCFLLFCTCDKEVITPEQQGLNLVGFVKCPFNEMFDSNTNLENYVLKKFGKPDIDWKERKKLGKDKELSIVVDWIVLVYNNDKYKSKFDITRGINKKLNFFDSILLLDFTDLKYEINNETTIKDIESLFGKSRDVSEIKDVYEISYDYYDDIYLYHLKFVFRKKKLSAIHIRTEF